MKILYVITKANWGGAQKYVYELARGAQAAGHEVVVAYGEPGELTEQLAAASIRTVALGGLARDVGLAREWRAFWALRSTLRNEHPNVVHLNSSKAGGLGALAARLAGVPRIVFTAHGWAFNEARPWWQKLIIYKLAWLTVLFAHTTICVSEAIRRDARFMPFIQRKLVLIYNGVEAPAYKTRADARRTLWPGHDAAKPSGSPDGSQSEPFRGVWVGMLSELHPTKRVEDAIEAIGRVPDARLVVLGEGTEHARLAALIHGRELGKRVRLAGFVRGGDAYLSAFDIFLHTSASEALCTAVIEAGLAGLPVVATNVGGIPEIVEGGVSGTLVPPRSPAAVAGALNALIKNPAHAQEMGEALRASCRARFSSERMLRETLALYLTA